jgi:hypothetical protein
MVYTPVTAAGPLRSHRPACPRSSLCGDQRTPTDWSFGLHALLRGILRPPPIGKTGRSCFKGSHGSLTTSICSSPPTGAFFFFFLNWRNFVLP